MSNEWAKDDQGTLQDGFTKDTDTFRLSEKLLELCLMATDLLLSTPEVQPEGTNMISVTWNRMQQVP